MDAIVTLFALVFAGLIAWVARRVIGSVSPDVPPTNQYEPKPDTGAPEPSPDEDYPLPDQPEPEDPLPLEPEPTPEPTPEPDPVPTPPVAVPTPPSDVFTRAEQAAFFKAIGLPYSTDAALKASTVKFQLACTWTDDAGSYIAADGGFGRLTTQVARKCIAADYRISKYFHLYEFRCKGQDAAQGSGAHCIACKIIYVDRNLVMALDLVREQIYQGPLSIVTGYRCDGYNAHVGGVTNSAHRLGLAADIPRKFSWARFTGRGFRGIGKSRVDRVSVVHVDRDTRLRADYVFQE